MNSALQKAKAAWLNTPAWIDALAEECDRTSQNRTAERLGVSGAQVSLVLKNKYTGNYMPIEEKVRGILMAEELICPVVGELTKDQCLDYQRADFIGTNSSRARLKRTCPKCPHFKLEDKK